MAGGAAEFRAGQQRRRSGRPCLEELEVRLALTAPVAVNDTYSTLHDQTLYMSFSYVGVLNNDTDAAGDTLSVASVNRGRDQQHRHRHHQRHRYRSRRRDDLYEVTQDQTFTLSAAGRLDQ